MSHFTIAHEQVSNASNLADAETDHSLTIPRACKPGCVGSSDESAFLNQ